MRASPDTRRLWAALALALFVGAVAAAVISSPAAADTQRAARKMSITISKPGAVLSGDAVTMRLKAKDQAGKAIKGVQVTFWWRLPNGTCTHKATTNAKGSAANSHATDCGSAAEYRAKVVVTARWHGQVRRATRYFTIVGGT